MRKPVEKLLEKHTLTLDECIDVAMKTHIQLKVAKKHVPQCAEKFILKDLTNKVTWKLYKDKDVFISTEVLEHITEDKLVLKSIPSGKLVIISVPNFGHHNHVRFFTSKEDIINRYGPMLDFISEIELIRF